MKSLGLVVLAFAAACTPGWTGTTPGPVPATSAAPQTASLRVVESATGLTVPFASLAERAARADVVFFGEQHDDPETHFAELALLEQLGRRHESVALSLEMFERDVQQSLDAFMSGAISDSVFLSRSRPWPRYATDYRPMVMLAKARGWPVVAANIPRPIASAVSREGLATFDRLGAESRAWAPAQTDCPRDAYYDRFAETMSGHAGAGGADTTGAGQVMWRFYEAQCAKDEAMAESIVRALPGPGRAQTIVMHVTGAFHSDYRQGTVMRVVRRAPGARALVITAVPVDDPARAALGNEGQKADYVIFTKK
jgi:uncharacterized iron-regulated protein